MNNPNQEKIQKQKSNKNKKKLELTPGREAILRYLADKRFATTPQINQELLNQQTRHYTWYELSQMQKAGWLQSFEAEAGKGTNSRRGWLLTRKGAEQIGASFGTHYRRQPSEERIKLRDMELEIARVVAFAGGRTKATEWNLVEPQVSSPARPLPPTTLQHQKLVEAVDFLVASQLKNDLDTGRVKPDGQSFAAFKNAQQRFSVPAQTNDYVVWLSLDGPTPSPLAVWAAALAPQHYDTFVTNHQSGDLNKSRAIRVTIALVMILCPPKAGPKFWLSKLDKYDRLAKYVPVYGIFDSEKDRQSAEQLLEKLAQDEKNKRLISGYGEHFKTLTLAQVYKELTQIAANIENRANPVNQLVETEARPLAL